ncbi:hypothetical protein [Streptomyces sp. NPDC001165]|uniref:hypothetical protein n=1 Tax=Streptomyces sp. NPDC001165 TaxID=3364546 RepID=UPI0036CB998E
MSVASTLTSTAVACTCRAALDSASPSTAVTGPVVLAQGVDGGADDLDGVVEVVHDPLDPLAHLSTTASAKKGPPGTFAT